MFLTKLATLLMSGGSVMAAENPKAWYIVLAKAIKSFLNPLLILACAAGSIYAIIIGIKMAQADSKEKRDEGRQRLITIVVAIVSVVVLIVLFNWVSSNIGVWIEGTLPTPSK